MYSATKMGDVHSRYKEKLSIGMCHTIDVFRLIYIEHILLADPFKCLNSYRI